MREAHVLYRSLGFRDRPAFENTESGLSGLEPPTLFLELPLGDQAEGIASPAGASDR